MFTSEQHLVKLYNMNIPIPLKARMTIKETFVVENPRQIDRTPSTATPHTKMYSVTQADIRSG